MPELVLYGIRELAKQFLGAILDIKEDHSGLTVLQLHFIKIKTLYQPIAGTDLRNSVSNCWQCSNI